MLKNASNIEPVSARLFETPNSAHEFRTYQSADTIIISVAFCDNCIYRNFVYLLNEKKKVFSFLIMIDWFTQFSFYL